MNVTVTLIVQIFSFGLLVWFVMRFLWEPLTNLMAEREKRIADGLAAAEKGKHDLELAEKHARDALRDAKTQARITSYNVCYTKLLRLALAGASV